MPDQAPTHTSAEARRFITFIIDARLYAVPAEAVSEVVRTPPLARVPQAPKGLLGLGNLRGQVTPVASVRALLNLEADESETSGLALVLSGAASTALAIGAAPTLIAAQAVQSEGFAQRPGELLLGVFKTETGDVAHILDVQALLAAAFVARPHAQTTRRTGVARAANAGRNDLDQEDKIISFSVAGQEFALPLEAVREVIAAPSVVAQSPHSEALVLGVTAYRDGLLPLLSLRALLGLQDATLDGREKVVVAYVAGAVVGLVADSANAIVGLREDLTDPPPAILAARAGGESQIKAVYRGEGGKRLISILAPEALFRDEVMQRLSHQAASARAEAEAATLVVEERFLAFRLGDDEFALPIESVTEVARMPEQITRVPNTPAFLEGVASHRGEVLPVVDQRRRFDMPQLTNDPTRRLIVVRSERHAAGVIVDSVSEVLSAPRDEIAPAPDLAGDKTRLVRGVINLEAAGRIVMVLDPAELLSRAERGLLDAFQADASAAK